MTRLHAFDLALCEHIRSVVGHHIQDDRFAERMAKLDARLFGYLQHGHEAAPAELLLSEQESLEIQTLARQGPVWPKLRKHLAAKPWFLPSPRISSLALACIKELNDQLSMVLGTEWAAKSKRFGKRLARPGLTLHEGIGTASEWIKLARRYLAAMGATQFLPPPEGIFPTPTSVAIIKVPAWTNSTATATKANLPGPPRTRKRKSPYTGEHYRALLNTRQAAEKLGISTDTLYSHAHAGRIGYRWKNKAGRGGTMLFSPADLEAFLEEISVAPAPVATKQRGRRAYVPRNF